MKLKDALAGYYTEEEGYVNKEFTVLRRSGKPLDGAQILVYDTKKFGKIYIVDEFIAWVEGNELPIATHHYFQVAVEEKDMGKIRNMDSIRCFSKYPWVKIIVPKLYEGKCYLNLDKMEELGRNPALNIPLSSTHCTRLKVA